MCFDRNINGNRDVKFFEWDYWSLHRRKKITLPFTPKTKKNTWAVERQSNHHTIPIVCLFSLGFLV
jgi:hypothetical protein